MIFPLAGLMSSCATAALFSLPNRKSETANQWQGGIAAAALPVAVAVDVVTSPVQLGAAGIYRIAKSDGKPAPAADDAPAHGRPAIRRGSPR